MRRLRVAAIALLLAVSLTGCTAGGGASSGMDTAPVPGIADPGAVDSGGESGGGQPGGQSGGGGDVGEDAGDGRSVIITGSVSLTVADPFEAADDATRAVEAAGGRVDGRTEQAAGERDGGRATLTVRIPSAAFSATLDDLERLGEVESIQLTSTDVTMRTEDLDARIAALRTSADRLLALLATAESTEDLLKVESALSERQADLESLDAERAYLADQVALTTITLTLLSEGIAPPTAPDDFWGGILAGFAGLVSALGAFAVGLGVILPWLVFAAIVALVVLLLVRAVGRRTRRTTRASVDVPGTPAE